MMTKTEVRKLASRVRTLRPQAGVDNAGRRLWADMVNAITGAVVPEQHLREFRECAGWEAQFDRAFQR